MKTLVILLIAGGIVLAIAFIGIVSSSRERRVAQTPALSEPIIRPSDPQRGTANAPIVLVEFADFACPLCAEMQPIIAELLARYPEKILHVWKDFPLPIHPHAPRAHRAARCAQEQGKFWEYHDLLFARESPYDEEYDAYAATAGLDPTAFTVCIGRNDALTRVDGNVQEGLLLRITETPTLFLNSKRFDGVTDIETLRRTIETQL